MVRTTQKSGQKIRVKRWERERTKYKLGRMSSPQMTYHRIYHFVTPAACLNPLLLIGGNTCESLIETCRLHQQVFCCSLTSPAPSTFSFGKIQTATADPVQFAWTYQKAAAAETATSLDLEKHAIPHRVWHRWHNFSPARTASIVASITVRSSQFQSASSRASTCPSAEPPGTFSQALQRGTIW